MQLHGTLKGLISLASVLSVFREKNFFASAGISPTTKNVFGMCGIETQTTIDSHLKGSQVRFDALVQRIDDSIKNRRYIHVEDGESDDYMHNIIAMMRDVVPQQVYLQGGFYKRKHGVAVKLWNYFGTKFSIRQPEIFTISARWENAVFDSTDGEGLLRPEEIQALDSAATEEDYKKTTADAQDALRETLEKNKFTTIALKTAPPTELVDVLEDFTQKVAIIWTGPIGKRTTGTYQTMFNYDQAPEAADRLLELNIPIVIVSPSLDNARMTSIIDEIYMDDFRKFVPVHDEFKTDPFKGFKGLAGMKLIPQAMYSHYFSLVADKFRDKMIGFSKESAKKFNEKLKEIEDDVSLALEKKQEQITENKALKETKTSLGNRWEYFLKKNTRDKIFREFCPTDQTVELVTDQELRESSVEEVLEVKMKRKKELHEGKEVELVPKKGGNTFIITKFDSQGLENKIQAVINKMASGNL